MTCFPRFINKIMNFYRVFPLILLSLFLTFSAQAQEYTTALGLRAGSASGIALRHFFTESTAIEGIIGYRRSGVRLIAAVEQQFELGRSSGTYLYFGGGGHIGYINLISDFIQPSIAYGADIVIGIEFTFGRSDMSLSLDFFPSIELANGLVFSGNNGGATIRFFLD